MNGGVIVCSEPSNLTKGRGVVLLQLVFNIHRVHQEGVCRSSLFLFYV
jgi:hypothetical protein